MISHIILDSGPLGLLLQKRAYPQVQECRAWLAAHIAAGRRIIVSEIIDYEVRRELLRLDKRQAIRSLDAFISARTDRYLPLGGSTLRAAAQLWAEIRRQGKPTADVHALDIDVILAAQVLNMGVPVSELVVATSNVSHLGRIVPAREWAAI